jgi:hypothetical protein
MPLRLKIGGNSGESSTAVQVDFVLLAHAIKNFLQVYNPNRLKPLARMTFYVQITTPSGMVCGLWAHLFCLYQVVTIRIMNGPYIRGG